MKSLKHLALAALVATALLLPLAATPPRPASAESDGCQALITSLQAIGSTIDKHKYQYDIACLPDLSIVRLQVSATYDVKTNTAQEDLKGIFVGQSTWNCSADPWIASTPPTCTFQGTTATDPSLFNTLPGPPGATYLDDAGHQLLTLELRRETLPDFTVVSVRAVDPKIDPVTKKELPLTNGTTAAYDVVVANMGARIPVSTTNPSPKFEVLIQVTGAVQYSSMGQVPADWKCTATASSPTNPVLVSPINCAGPTLGLGGTDANPTVTLTLQVRAAKAGVGAITVSADPNGLVDESDEKNNDNQLIITVK